MVTGNFDAWGQTQGILAKDADSDAFEAILRVPERQKLVFKFVINGSDWVTDESYKIEHDEHGNPNNYVDADELVEVQEFTKEATPVEAEPVAVAEEEPKVTVPAKAEPDTRDEEERLTNVLTSGSSYAAVSVPDSEGSGYENISRAEEDNFDASNRLARNRTAPEDITPTTSNAGGAAAKQGSSGSTGATQDSEVTTLGPNSRNSSFTGRPQQPDGETVDALKVPGSFPLPVKTIEKRTSRRDGLITRLKGMFRS